MYFACPLNHCSYKAMLINVLPPKQAMVVFLAFIRIQVQIPTSIIHKIRQMCVFSYLVILVPQDALRCYVELSRQSYGSDCVKSQCVSWFILKLFIRNELLLWYISLIKIASCCPDNLTRTGLQFNLLAHRITNIFWYISLIKIS